MSTNVPTGRAAEAWARLCATAEARWKLLPILRVAASAMPDPARGDALAACEALERDLGTLLNLGCPVPGGFAPMALPHEILGAARV